MYGLGIREEETLEGLEESIVPEWRIKYIDYKGGKKKIKNVAKAIKYTSQASPAEQDPANGKSDQVGRFKWLSRNTSGGDGTGTGSTTVVGGSSGSGEETVAERSPLAPAAGRMRAASVGQSQNAVQAPYTQYGTLPPPSLHLPEPMQPLEENGNGSVGVDATRTDLPDKAKHIPGGPDVPFPKRKLLPFSKNKALTSFTKANSRPALIKRVISASRVPGATMAGRDMDVDDIRDEAIEEFFRWMETELHKIDTFYRMKEDEAVRRLEELREQLHIMRDMRIAEIRNTTRVNSSGSVDDEGLGPAKQKKKHLWKSIGVVRHSFVAGPSPSSILKAEALQRITTATPQLLPDIRGRMPASFTTMHVNSRSSMQSTREQGYFRQLTAEERDYTVQRHPINEITYRVAKRKLKAAMMEYYRGLELLKSYCHQNREGLRKINKKFDKATGLRTSKRFMNEKVNKSYFGSSDVLENLIHQTEDLFCPYFVRGDRKHAVERLRTKDKPFEFYGSMFRSGILLGLGFFAGVQGVVLGFESAATPGIEDQSSYLLQLWAGFFLPLFFMLLFTLNCRAWAKSIIWIIISFWRSRRWFLYANWRLLLSGLYPVEFRDFWLGDMYCSLTYTMGNIALFSCLYNDNWDTPGKCNSSHSRLLGFFSCLPGIWRLLQCLRRYYDTRNAFPHLANAGKYACTVLYYVSLSLWRIEKTEESKALFIALGTVNAVYCSTWDLAMDWSLLNPYASWPFLRQEMGFKRPYLYYLAMIVDPLLRFNWVFYIIFARDIQHSTLDGERTLHKVSVGNFRAYREIPLPYELPPQTASHSLKQAFTPYDMSEPPSLKRALNLSQYAQAADINTAATSPSATDGITSVPGRLRSLSSSTLPGATAPYTPQPAPSTIQEHPDLERQATYDSTYRASGPQGRPSGAIQRRGSDIGTPAMRALNAMGTALARAHTQDFERRKEVEQEGEGSEEEDSESSGGEDEREEHRGIDGRVGENEVVRRGEQAGHLQRSMYLRYGVSLSAGEGNNKSIFFNAQNVSPSPGSALAIVE
ncbi:EXS family-domain-containing protein [Kalaharituber pfeilii]|nr:EXS family-domain-containing protein [Kalaharituber pfeilii]